MQLWSVLHFDGYHLAQSVPLDGLFAQFDTTSRSGQASPRRDRSGRWARPLGEAYIILCFPTLIFPASLNSLSELLFPYQAKR